MTLEATKQILCAYWLQGSAASALQYESRRIESAPCNFFFFHYQHVVASQHLICCFLLAPSCLSLPPSIPLSLLVVLLIHLKRRERHALYHTISNNHHYSASTELVRPASLSRADSASTPNPNARLQS